MLKSILDTSIFISWIRRMGRIYLSFEERIFFVGNDSVFLLFIKRFKNMLSLYLGNSVTGRIIYGDIEPSVVIRGSRCIDILSKSFRALEFYSKTGAVFGNVAKARGNFYLFPLKGFGIIIIVSILTNTFFSLLLDIRIAYGSWLMRSLLIFLGLSCMSCSSGWEELKDSSLLFRLLNKYCKKQN